MMNTILKSAVAMVIAVSLSAAWAGDHPDMDHSGMDHSDMQHNASPNEASVEGTRDPHAYSGGHTLDSGAYALPGPRMLKLADEHNFGLVAFDKLERVQSSDAIAVAYDAEASYGRDYDKLVIKAEGATEGGNLHSSTELLWQKAIAAFWDVQLGVRHDKTPDSIDNWLALGLPGLAPYWFEVDATAYVGEKGKTVLRLDVEYDLMLTQRLILQPQVELNIYGKSDPAHAIGSGLSEGVAGLRLRYELTRQFAPYVGIEWEGVFGETADFARAADEPVSESRWVAGLSVWF